MQSFHHHQDGVHQLVDGELWIISGYHGDEALPGCNVFNFDTETYRKCYEVRAGGCADAL